MNQHLRFGEDRLIWRKGQTNLFSPNLPRPTTSKHLFTRLDMLRFLLFIFLVAEAWEVLRDIVGLGA